MKRSGMMLLSLILAACATTMRDSSTWRDEAAVVTFHQQKESAYPGDAVNRATDKLMAAASQGEIGKVEALLNEGALIDGWSGATPHLAAVFAAAHGGHLDTMRYLMSRGARLDIKSYGTGYTVLHYAAYGGHSEMLEFLLDQRLDVNGRDREGRTALHAAAFGGHADAARVLLERGVNASIRDANGKTAADTAKERGHSALELMLGGNGTE